MRIIGGYLKGRNILAPSQLPVRPTTDFAKEGLLNVLVHRLDLSNMRVLDLFSGTGNMSYEFISRGAKEVFSVDESYACIQFISKVCHDLNISNLKPIKSTVNQFLKHNSTGFDLIFADPPFDFDKYPELIHDIVDHHVIINKSIFIIEHHEKTDVSKLPMFKEERKYGSIKFSFFQAL